MTLNLPKRARTAPRLSDSMFRGLLVLGTLGSSMSCADPGPFEVRYETEYLRIGTEFDYPLCGGDLAYLDAQVAGLEEALSTRAEAPINLYLWENPPKGYCATDDSPGCYSSATHTIHSTSFSLDHELVHAVVASFADPPPFFSEGAAEALDRRRLVSVQTPDPLANFERSTAEVDYGSAGLFMRWLWERYGPELFIALLEDSRPPFEAFEGVYGLTAEAAEEMFFAELPHSYPPLVDCQIPELPEVGNGQWSEGLVLDCSRDDVRGGDGLQATARLLTITQPGSYAIEFEGSAATINRCADEFLITAPEEGDPAWGDVPPTTSTMPGGYVRAINGADEADVLNLVPGRYMLTVADAPGELVNLSVAAAAAP